MTDIPVLTDHLYHYTTADIGLDSMMAQMQLRLGLVESTNDPRESRPRYPTLQRGDGVPLEDAEDIWREADRLMRRAAKVACFTLDYELPDSVRDRAALSGYAHPALWAHYGGRHTGVCLRFSRHALFKRMQDTLASQGRLFDGPVEYGFEPGSDAAVRPLDVEQLKEFGIDAVVVRYIEQHHRALFFQKHPDWSSEREYRWVFVEPGPLPVYVDISGCLTGVVLGDSFPDWRLDALDQLSADCGGLDVGQVRFHNGWQHFAPVTAPPLRTPRPHHRSGTPEERLRALDAAEHEAAEARARGELLAAPLLSRITSAIWDIADRVQTAGDVEVRIHPGIHAVPPSERRRAAGVPTNSVEYESGAMCVMEALPKQSHTFVASAAVQVLVGGDLKLHAAFELERWVASGTERRELWRRSPLVRSDAAEAEQCADDLIQEMLDGLEGALTTFDEQRTAGASPA